MTVLSFFNLAAVVLGLSALFGYVIHRWLDLPHTFRLVVQGLGRMTPVADGGPTSRGL